MTKQEFLNHIEQTYKDGLEIIKKKNADYAIDTNPFQNFDSAIVAGVEPERAILIRILDKLSRISNCLNKDIQVKDETIEDTLLDAINYLAILKAKIYDTKRNKTSAV